MCVCVCVCVLWLWTVGVVVDKQEAFTAKPLPSAPAPAAYVYQPSTVKFEGVSTSRADFTPKPLERPAPLGPAAGVGAGRPSIPFTGESESRSAYPYVLCCVCGALQLRRVMVVEAVGVGCWVLGVGCWVLGGVGPSL